MSIHTATSPLDYWSPAAGRLRNSAWILGMNMSNSPPMYVHDRYVETSNFGGVPVHDRWKSVNLERTYGKAQVSARAIGSWKPWRSESAAINDAPFVLSLIWEGRVPILGELRGESDTQAAQDSSTKTLDRARIMGFSDIQARVDANRKKYADRIETLRSLGKEDGIDLNPESEQDFMRFLDFVPSILEGDLILLENGDLRAIWDDELGAHIGLQFQGSGEVQYVIFSRRLSTGKKRRGCGSGDFDLVKHQIEAYDLWSLVSGKG